MTDIDISKIKPGDVVTVRAEEIEIWPGALYIKAPTGAKVWMARQDIATHEPAPEPLKIGDVVTVEGGTTSYTITGLHNDAAWLSFAHTYKSAPVSKLRRVEQP